MENSIRAAQGAGPRVFGVAEIVSGVRELLEERVGRIWVAGEASNVKRAASGHVYFTLKEESAQLRAVLFRSAARRVAFEIEDGLDLLACGELTIYERRGDLQLIVRELEPRGIGALQLAFEQLRLRLDAEGLFDPEKKRSLPDYPRAIGVVTSLQGAALGDVIEILRTRAPEIPVVIAPARVQGEGAEQELALAIDALGRCEDVDTILLVRGGGSLEDLMAFNTERIARALRDSLKPVVSGVGHEGDVTIADLAADFRAPTPSAAAACAVPDRAELLERLGRYGRDLFVSIDGLLSSAHAELAGLQNGLGTQAPYTRLLFRRRDLEAVRATLLSLGKRQLQQSQTRFSELGTRLDALSPLAVLDRGYAIVSRLEDGRIVRQAKEIPLGTDVRAQLAKGSVVAKVIGCEDGSS